jgi:hypothetical protein
MADRIELDYQNSAKPKASTARNLVASLMVEQEQLAALAERFEHLKVQMESMLDGDAGTAASYIPVAQAFIKTPAGDGTDGQALYNLIAAAQADVLAGDMGSTNIDQVIKRLG